MQLTFGREAVGSSARASPRARAHAGRLRRLSGCFSHSSAFGQLPNMRAGVAARAGRVPETLPGGTAAASRSHDVASRAQTCTCHPTDPRMCPRNYRKSFSGLSRPLTRTSVRLTWSHLRDQTTHPDPPSVRCDATWLPWRRRCRGAGTGFDGLR